MNCKPRCGKFIVMALLGVAALSWAVMALWNWLMPDLFAGAREIGYLQAVGLLVLSKILFGFRGHGGPGHWHRRQLEQMTPEEREKFRSGMSRWCGRRKDEIAPPADTPRE
jgi:hypothetical protein